MKTFRDYLKEEIKIGALASGGIGIERDVVRDEINGILSGIGSQPCITPYGSLNRIRKALAYFSIFLPKKVYMEGRHGIEVWEIHQFGDKMGMTDQGEFIKSVPAKYYLFLHYHLIGSMYFLESKIVDDNELEERLNRAENMVAEEADAANRQGIAKAMAPKEPMHDEDDEGTESTKKAVEVSMRRKDKKLSADSLDEASTEKLVSYRNKAGEGREKGTKLAYAKLTGKAKVKASAPKHPYMEESIDEAMTRKQKDMAVRRFMRHDPEAGERILKMGKKDREEKKSFASAEKEANKWQKHRLGEEQIDELRKSTLGSYIKKASHDVATRSAETRGGAMKSAAALEKQDYTGFRKHGQHSEKMFAKSWKRRQGIARAADKLAKEETQINEGGMPASVIAHKQKLASMSDKEFAEKHGHKTEKQLRDMGARHGYGFDKATKTGSDHYVKRAASKQIDEGGMPASVIKHKQKLANMTPEELKQKFAGKSEEHLKSMARRHGYGKDSDVYSKHVKENELDEAMGSVKKDTGYRKLRTKVSTVVRRGLNKKKEAGTILVTKKGDPAAATGGGVRRIRKDKYDPSKHNLASE